VSGSPPDRADGVGRGGGRAAQYALDSLYLAEICPTPFNAAVVLYPLCLYAGLRRLNASLLILIGVRRSHRRRPIPQPPAFVVLKARIVGDRHDPRCALGQDHYDRQDTKTC
jgi:hypothetical protein